jgi:ribonuclease P protein component
MLSAKNRLNKREVERIFRKGANLSESFLYARFLENKAKRSRFAIIVSKKIHSGAVERNRLRRKTYAILQELMPNFSDRNLDMAIGYRSAPKSEEEIAPIIEKDLKKTGNLSKF